MRRGMDSDAPIGGASERISRRPSAQMPIGLPWAERKFGNPQKDSVGERSGA